LISEVVQALSGVCTINNTQADWFGAQENVVQSGVRACEHEMLMDHADTARDGGRRGGPMTRHAIDKNLTAVRLVKSIEQLHGSGFARPILTNDAMDCATLYAEIYAGVSEDVAEALGDAAQFNGWILDRHLGPRMNTNGQELDRRKSPGHFRL
jgi:hypothetical protein